MQISKQPDTSREKSEHICLFLSGCPGRFRVYTRGNMELFVYPRIKKFKKKQKKKTQ